MGYIVSLDGRFRVPAAHCVSFDPIVLCRYFRSRLSSRGKERWSIFAKSRLRTLGNTICPAKQLSKISLYWRKNYLHRSHQCLSLYTRVLHFISLDGRAGRLYMVVSVSSFFECAGETGYISQEKESHDQILSTIPENNSIFKQQMLEYFTLLTQAMFLPQIPLFLEFYLSLPPRIMHFMSHTEGFFCHCALNIDLPLYTHELQLFKTEKEKSSLDLNSTTSLENPHYHLRRPSFASSKNLQPSIELNIYLVKMKVIEISSIGSNSPPLSKNMLNDTANRDHPVSQDISGRLINRLRSPLLYIYI